MAEQTINPYTRIRLVMAVGMYPISLVAWLTNGLGKDDWRTGAIVASWIALVTLGGITLTYVLEGSILVAANIIVVQAMVPVGALTWAHTEGRAWLWVVGWMYASNSLLSALLMTGISRFKWQAPVSRFAPQWRALGGIYPRIRIGRWIVTAAAFAGLVLAQLGAPPAVCFPLWVVAALGTLVVVGTLNRAIMTAPVSR